MDVYNVLDVSHDLAKARIAGSSLVRSTETPGQAGSTDSAFPVPGLPVSMACPWTSLSEPVGPSSPRRPPGRCSRPRGVSGDIFIRMQMSEVPGLDGCVVVADDPGRVEAISESLIGLDVAGELAEMFRLLGDPTRVRILFALLEAGELCVCDLAAVVDTSDTKVSQALRLLRGAGVVRNRRDGRNVFYRLDDAHVRMVLDISREHVAHLGQGG